MSIKKPFDSVVLAAKIYKARRRIFQNIKKNRAIERYLISTRSRRDFVAFYKIRLKKANADRLYGYLVRYMGRQTCPTIVSALNRINKITGTIELSNASKVIASLDRTKPPYDKKVRGHLDLDYPNGDSKKARDIYALLLQRMSALLRQKDVTDALHAFDGAFPHVSGKKILTKMKKLDLMLWQMPLT
jgi:hypothetical protein